MTEKMNVMGEAAFKNTEKHNNEGGYAGVSAGIVNDYGFDINSQQGACEWLLRELEKQRCRVRTNFVHRN